LPGQHGWHHRGRPRRWPQHGLERGDATQGCGPMGCDQRRALRPRLWLDPRRCS
jgi:hypothetical protein